MAELLVRITGQDEALLRRTLGSADRPGIAFGPDRIVVDAHVAAAHPALSALTQRAGLPYLIDPQTHFLQDRQHRGDAWAALPFATAETLTPAELTSASRQDQLIRACVEFQIAHGATALLAPYVHVDKPSSPWLPVQLALWDRLRRFLDQENIQLPVIAVAAAGWRLTTLTARPALRLILAAVQRLNPAEVALAISKVHTGAHADDRLVDLIEVIRQVRRLGFPVLAWNQGLLGEACIAGGASGYETGLGQREKCDLTAAMVTRRHPPASRNFGARPVYVPVLKRSIPKDTLSKLQQRGPRPLWLAVQCANPTCCPTGAAVLDDARLHALYSRAWDLHALAQVHRPSWQWSHLEGEAAAGLQLADRLNRFAATEGTSRVDAGALFAVRNASEALRLYRRARRIA